MLARASSVMAILALAGCQPAAPPAEVADGPVGPRLYLCDDGTAVEHYAQMGGIVLVIDGTSVSMPQIAVEGETGHVHQAGHLGWITDFPDGARLIRIGAGETIQTAPQVPCHRQGAIPGAGSP